VSLALAALVVGSNGIALAQKGEDHYLMGRKYLEGTGVKQDNAEAAKWFRKAAEQGHADAQAHLGWMYEQGRGVPQSDAEAVRWYRKAADQGHAQGQNNLGVMYEQGRGVPQSYAEAAKWFRKAAEQGNVLGLYNLGRMYANGHGVPRDDAEAVKWYRKAAEQGDAHAQNRLRERGLTWTVGSPRQAAPPAAAGQAGTSRRRPADLGGLDD